MDQTTLTRESTEAFSADALLAGLTELADLHDMSGSAFREAALGYLKNSIKAARKDVEADLIADGKRHGVRAKPVASAG